mmetsp:Transcript_55878/g.130519  ORF Transcript_55878/g.130519 Transcript_55878/m.130519 type:complete len:886 (-) Transcript_55878:246-2903(-)
MQAETPARRIDEPQKSPQGSGDGWTQSSSPTEVYDIACDSEDDDIGHISSAVRALDVDGDLSHCHERSPGSSRKGTAYDASTAPSSCRALARASEQAEAQADAWNVEDWDSHLAQLQEVATPCRAFDGEDLQVAATVRAELQADLETLVQAAMDEMRSWLSQEIAFARSSLDEADSSKKRQQNEDEVNDLHKRVEDQGQKLEELQENQLEKLRREVQEQARVIKRLEDMTSPEPRCSTSSERVMEARAVAEERKWRLRLENLESSLNRNAETIASCSQKVMELEERVTANDSDLQRGLCASQIAEKQSAETTRELNALRTSLEKQAEDFRQFDKKLHSLASESKSSKDERDALRKRLAEQADSLGTVQRSAQEANASQRQQKEEMLSFSTRIQETLAQVAACKTDCLAVQTRMENVTQQAEEAQNQSVQTDQKVTALAEMLHTATSDLEVEQEHVQSLQLGFDKHEHLVKVLEGRFSAFELKSSKTEESLDKRVRQLEREVSTNETELATVQGCLESHNEHLSSLDQQRLALTAKAAVQEEQVQKAWAAVEGLENQAHADHKELLRLRSSLKDQGQEMETTRSMVVEQAKAHSAVEGRLDTHDQQNARRDETLESLRHQTSSLREDKLPKIQSEVSNLEDKVQALSKEQQIAAASIQKTGEGLEALIVEFQDQAKAQGVFKDRLDNQETQNQRYDEILENLLQQNTTLLDQAFTWDADLRCAAQRLTTLEDRSENFGDELENVRQTVSGCITKLQEDLVAMQRDQSSVSEAATQLQQDMSAQVTRIEVQQMHADLQNWITSTRQAMDRWMSASLDKFQKEQGLILEKNQGWVHRVKRWIEKIHIREQGLSHVILHILQEGSPDVVKLLEEALKLPHKPVNQAILE